MDQTLASVLAKFAVETTHADIPDNVRKAALGHIVDTIGVCIAAASPHEESGQVARRLAEKWQTESGATIFGINSKSRPEMAALLNGSLAQALEMDDKHGSSLARPGSTVTPAVLAVAQANNMSLNDVVTAVTVGYEVMIRLGFVGGERFLERGYHTSSLLGAFGTVAAVGSLLKSSVEDIMNGMGIAGTFAAGIQEATRTGSTSKILHGGWGAHSGIVALDLATAGITGPATVFEGKFGFFNCFLTPITGQLDFAKAAEGLGSRWYLPETAYKPYPCCQLLHAFIEGAKQIREELKTAGKPLETITAISCQLAEPGLTLVTEPLDRKAAPSHPHEARFSLPYGVATTLLYGDVDVESFRPERLKDQEVLRLAKIVVSSEDPDSDYPLHCPAILEVTSLGKVHRRHVRFHPGSPEAALSQSDVLDKFARNSNWLYGQNARQIGTSLMKTENISLDALLRQVGTGVVHAVKAAV
jgi:2-methylcitrate dehydratase PrpD